MLMDHGRASSVVNVSLSLAVLVSRVSTLDLCNDIMLTIVSAAEAYSEYVSALIPELDMEQNSVTQSEGIWTESAPRRPG